mgnify:CR=1 FL=1
MTPKNIEPARKYEAGDTMTPKSLDPVREHIASQVIGQHNLVDGMLICLLSDGHLLVEGMPGLAKTLLISSLAQVLALSFNRIQFTPDLMPSDIVGTNVFDIATSQFHLHQGAIFAGILLADDAFDGSDGRGIAAILKAEIEKKRRFVIGLIERYCPKGA